MDAEPRKITGIDTTVCPNCGREVNQDDGLTVIHEKGTKGSWSKAVQHVECCYCSAEWEDTYYFECRDMLDYGEEQV